jgi:hypothetical protein
MVFGREDGGLEHVFQTIEAFNSLWELDGVRTTI